MRPKKKKLLAISVSLFLILGIIIFVIFPPTIALDPIQGKPVILYYNFENLPFPPSEFSAIVNTTLAHHFNTLMLLVYYNHQAIFNRSTVQQFYLYLQIKEASLLSRVTTLTPSSTGSMLVARCGLTSTWKNYPRMTSGYFMGRCYFKMSLSFP